MVRETQVETAEILVLPRTRKKVSPNPSSAPFEEPKRMPKAAMSITEMYNRRLDPLSCNFTHAKAPLIAAEYEILRGLMVV